MVWLGRLSLLIIHEGGLESSMRLIFIEVIGNVDLVINEPMNYSFQGIVIVGQVSPIPMVRTSVVFIPLELFDHWFVLPRFG